jgi:oligopeptide transport system permease protein
MHRPNAKGKTMGRYIARRLLAMFGVLFVVSVITFGLMHALPGGPFDGEKALAADIKRNLEQKFHLDKSIVEQYLLYMGGIVIPRIHEGKLTTSEKSASLITIRLGDNRHLLWMDFGPTYKSLTRSVSDIFREQLPVSALLGFVALLVALSIGIPMGLIAALNRNKPADYAAMGVAIMGVSFPAIISAPVLIWVFSINLKLFPVSGWGTLGHAILPSLALGFASSALIARLTRASALEVLQEDYIRTARAKGLAERRVITIHTLKNAMIPVVTVIGPLFAALITGTLVVEQQFGIPGIGRYFVTSITNRDYTVIMGTVLLYAFVLVISNVLVDVSYAWLDPRIRFN